MKKNIIIVILTVIVVVVVAALVYLFTNTPAVSTSAISVDLTGKIICLPVKANASSNACTLGLRSNNNNYVLNGISQTDQKNEQTGNMVEVKGILSTPATNSIYDVVGVIEVNSFDLTSNNNNASSSTSTSSSSLSGSSAGSAAYANQNPSFSFSHPSDWGVKKAAPQGQTASFWSELSQTPGQTFVTVTSPTNFMAGTNFHDARFSIGESTNARALSQCTTPLPTANNPQGNGVEKVTIDGVNFTKLSRTGAGAGNRYETVSYRTVKDNTCYALEYQIHYSPIDFYQGTNTKQFDQAKVEQMLQNMAGSFRFGK
jgi:hypothetical protein